MFPVSCGGRYAAKEPDERVIRQLKKHGAECALASPVWHELTYGCRRLPAGKRRVALEAYLEGGLPSIASAAETRLNR